MRTPAKLIVFLITAAVLTACQNPSTDTSAHNSVAHDQTIEVRKSPNDDRQYRYLDLPNKMRVLLVSDPTTDSAAAALAVYRGSMHEPAERPGLAHFLEHMLFIQTEAYPEPGAFQAFVAANGGSTNAYTALDHTNYFFSVQPKAFSEALDRFGHFFIDPIISDKYSQREKNAVHSEYQMQIKNDAWRGSMVAKQSLNPQHPASHFNIGSLETLAGDVQADLINFFDTQYSADQMGLVVLADTSLDTLEQQVRALFGQVANKNLGPRYFNTPIYEASKLPMRVSSESTRQGANITYGFPIPATRPHYKTKPQQYFANLLGHEGKGGLHNYLQSRGWIESLSAGVADVDRYTSVVNISIELTPLGETHQQQITQALFAYIDMLQNTPPQAWLYAEQAKLAQLGFRFQEKSSPTGLVYQLAPRLDLYPPEDLLVAPFLMEEFDAQLVQDYLGYLRPDNLVIDFTAPQIQATSVEPWFKVPYRIDTNITIPPPQADSNFTLPAANPFLPDNLELVADDNTPMRMVSQSDLSSADIDIWLDTDLRFGAPRASLNVQLAIPGGLVSPADRAMAQLYRKVVTDNLNLYTYPAYLAGLSFGISVPDAGFAIEIGGYDDKQLQLLEKMLAELFNATVDPARFADLKAELIKDWENIKSAHPYRQNMAALDDTLRIGRWPRPRLIAALAPVTPEDLAAWRDTKLRGVGVLAMLHGNVTEQALQPLLRTVQSHVPVIATPAHTAVARELRAALRLELDIDHNDAAMVLHVQDPDTSLTSRARSSLAAQMMQPEYFRELRTDQQLGYIVSLTNRPIARRGGITFIIQSPSASAADLEQATLEFTQKFNAELVNLSPADLEEHKAGLINRLLQKPKNLNEQSQRYWNDIIEGFPDLNSREQVADLVAGLTLADMQTYFQRLQTKLEDNSGRLLIYSKGKFDRVPSRGRLLASPVEPF